jgi:hypothetical protein
LSGSGLKESLVAESFEAWLSMLGRALRTEGGVVDGPLALKVMSQRLR